MHGQFVIPPGAADYRVESDLTFTRDVKLLNLLPHSHLRGCAGSTRRCYPDGRRETILSVPEYDFNWQTDYIFAEPLACPTGRGSTLRPGTTIRPPTGRPGPDGRGAVGRADRRGDEVHGVVVPDRRRLGSGD